MERSAGILMPISSLPSPYGIGTFGKAAFTFVDFLSHAKQSYWQILPVGPTGYGDSPYSSFSSFAGNPYFIDLDELCREKLLRKKDFCNIDWGSDETRIDYGLLYQNRMKVLRKAADALLERNDEEFRLFLNEEKEWLDDYALFMTIKAMQNGKSFRDWPEELRYREKKALEHFEELHKHEINQQKAIQYLFFRQWKKVKEYANSKGIRIIGDIPIYVSADSVEIWSEPRQFQTDEKGELKRVSGYPPENETDDGQRWGTPLYDWKYLAKDHYSWWVRRIRGQLKLYDVLRLDHFIGFSRYYAIPAENKTARGGSWKKGPGYSLFKTIRHELGDVPFIAEDLGWLDDGTRKLLKQTGFPGMKNMIYAFFPDNPSSDYLPHKFVRNCVVYPSTHDSEPLVAWFKTADKGTINKAIRYLRLDEEEGYNWGMIRGAYAGVENLVIVQLQDYLGLDEKARMNDPSRSWGNWKWRCLSTDLKRGLSARIAQMTELYDRVGS